MRTARILLVLPGLAALVWGAMLLLEFALPLGPQTVAALGWLAGGTLVHDAVVAPLAGIVGLVVYRLAGPSWRAPVLAGTVLTGVLTLLAFPLLWRDFGAPPLPGLHDGDTFSGLLLTLAVVWTGVLLTGLIRSLLRARTRENGSRATERADRSRVTR